MLFGVVCLHRWSHIATLCLHTPHPAAPNSYREVRQDAPWVALFQDRRWLMRKELKGGGGGEGGG